jgi:hypothetical protein
MRFQPTLIRPAVTYGAETWTMTTKDEQAVLIFERKIFRTIYGPKYEDGEWKSRTNRELEELSKGENIVKWIKGQRISWLGHLERMEEDRMPLTNRPRLRTLPPPHSNGNQRLQRLFDELLMMGIVMPETC